MTRARYPAALLVAPLLAAPGPAAAADGSYFSLETSTTYGVGTDEGQTVEAAVELSPRLETALSSRATIELSARLRVDEADRLMPDEPDLSTYSQASRPATFGTRGTAELRDAYVQIDLDRTLLRLGKQQIVWGALDGIKVLDALNPQSFEEFILDDFGSSRIGLWSLYADVVLDRMRLELALIPDTTTHHVPEPGAWFALTAPRFRFGAPATAELPELTVRRPGNDLADGTAGLRVSFPLGRLEVRSVAVSGIDFEPLGRLAVNDDGAPRVERYHERREILGLSAETALGPFALRVETGYLPSRHFNVRRDGRLDAAPLDQWRGGLGVDVQAPLNLFLNVQYVHDEVLDAPPGLVRPRRERTVTTFVRRRFSYDRINTELRWYTSLDENDGLIRAEVGYEFRAGTRLRLLSDKFYGRSDGIFGQFDGRSRISLVLEHTF